MMISGFHNVVPTEPFARPQCINFNVAIGNLDS